MPKNQMPVAERRRDSRRIAVTPRRSSWGTGRMPVRATGPERVLTWAGEPLNTEADDLMNRRFLCDSRRAALSDGHLRVVHRAGGVAGEAKCIDGTGGGAGECQVGGDFAEHRSQRQAVSA